MTQIDAYTAGGQVGVIRVGSSVSGGDCGGVTLAEHYPEYTSVSGRHRHYRGFPESIASRVAAIRTAKSMFFLSVLVRFSCRNQTFLNQEAFT